MRRAKIRRSFALCYHPGPVARRLPPSSRLRAGGPRFPALAVLGAASLLAATPGCRPAEEGAAAAPGGEPAAVFVDRAAEAGLDFVHFNGASGEYYMVEILGAGAALADLDGDGDLDAYLVQGEMLGPGKTLADAVVPPRGAGPLSGRLFRNDTEHTETGPELRFTDVTEASGVARLATGYGMGVAAGDYDNDGRVDLYLTSFGPNRLLRNLGPGADGVPSFEDATSAAGAGDDRWSVAAAFFDYDRDGWLDLFVGNYVDFDFGSLPVCRDLTGARDYCGPNVFPPQADRLLRNLGPDPDGRVRFADVTAEAGLTGGFGPALGVVTADLDDDGRLDLYVANDAKPNNLWRNRGPGPQGRVRFTDEALLAGAAVDAAGKAQGSMGVDAGDFDGDGDLDLFMTHLNQETNTLYLNDGGGMFADASAASGLGAPSLAYTGFGTAWIDYDNDGWLDLLVANGAVTRILALVRRGDPFPLHQPNQLFRNRGGAGGGPRFVEVTAEAGEVFTLSEVSRGAAFGDVDDDGDVDVLLTNNSGPARLLVNQVGSARPWVGVEPVLADRPRVAYGARAAVLRRGRPELWRRVRPEGSFASSNDPRILFGLGDDPEIEGVRVVWPDGSREDFHGVPLRRYTRLVQGTGRPVAPPEEETAVSPEETP